MSQICYFFHDVVRKFRILKVCHQCGKGKRRRLGVCRMRVPSEWCTDTSNSNWRRMFPFCFLQATPHCCIDGLRIQSTGAHDDWRKERWNKETSDRGTLHRQERRQDTGRHTKSEVTLSKQPTAQTHGDREKEERGEAHRPDRTLT